MADYFNELKIIICHSQTYKVLFLQGPFFEMVLTKECLEELETDGCFLRLLAREISQSLFRANDLIYKENDYGSEVIITFTLETHCDLKTFILYLKF